MKNDSSNTEIAPVTTLPESVRIPLNSLQADLEYLIGRVIADGSCGPMIAASIKERLDAVEAGIRDVAQAEPYPSIEAMKAAVELEILSALGRVHTVKIGQMIQKIIDAAPQPPANANASLGAEHPANYRLAFAKQWTPDQFWEYVSGLAGEHERDQMRGTLAERGLRIVGIGDDAYAGQVREALELAEDVLSRSPFSTDIWPNGVHPNTGITKIRAALSSMSSTEGK